MSERNPGSAIMIENYVGNSLEMPVPGDSNRRQWQRMWEVQVDRDKAFHAALQQQLRVGLQQLGIMAVDAGKEEIILLTQIAFDAGDY